MTRAQRSPARPVYAADAALPDVAFACLLSSRDSEGTDQGLRSQSRARPARRPTFSTYETIGDDIRKVKFSTEGGPASNSVVPSGSAEIAYAGQTIAMVLAETLEAAQDAAYQIGVEYEENAVDGDLQFERRSRQELAAAEQETRRPQGWRLRGCL